MRVKTPLMTLAFLAAICTASFSGCGSSGSSHDSTSGQPESSAVTTVSEASAEAASATDTAAVSEAAPESAQSVENPADDSDTVDFGEVKYTNQPLAHAKMTAGSSTLTFEFTDIKCGLSLYILRCGEKEYSECPLEKDTAGNYTAEIDLAPDKLAEMRLIGEVGGEKVFNEYYIDRSGNTDKGYIYKSLDSCVEAYMNTNKTNNFILLAENTVYENGTLRSLNQATHITADDVSAFTGGEIYSVTAPDAVDRSTVSWYKLSNGEWTAVPTDLSTDEGVLGARADLDGTGIYVLMGEPK